MPKTSAGVGFLSELEDYGWKPLFQQQRLEFEDRLLPVRVLEVHRSGLRVGPILPLHEELVMGGKWFQLPVESRPTVGDWILVDPESGSIDAVLPRVSEIKRLSPAGDVQMIAANIDTAFVVTSANSDFSLERVERYLSVLLEAEIQPVVVITKVDIAVEPQTYLDTVRNMHGDVPVELVNALDPDDLLGLVGWCSKGQSIALLGSSGVGKSTLVNTMMGEQVQATQASRESDDKGRHTTTHRSFHRLPTGGVILDSPGMREFQITDVDAGVSSVFEDIETLALACKFNDCAHQSEPDCAIRTAVEAGVLDERRLRSFFKLQREDRVNTETVAERHARSRQLRKMVRPTIATKPKPKR